MKFCCVVVAVEKNFYKTLTHPCVAKLSSVMMLSVFRVTSLCHTVTLVSRCLPVPGVSHTECHSPGPRSALCVTALGAGPAGQSRVARCPGCPRHKSRDQLRDTGDTRHWPARLGCPGRLVHRGCSAHLSHCPHPGTWSLVTPGIPDPPWSPPSDDIRLLLHQPPSLHPLVPKPI